MRCYLMHQHIQVLTMELDEATCTIASILSVDTPRHLPLGILDALGKLSREQLNNWLLSRSIPSSRKNIRDILEECNICLPSHLILNCLGLSLSDHYWIKPESFKRSWKDINFLIIPSLNILVSYCWGQICRTVRRKLICFHRIILLMVIYLNVER